MQKFCPIVWDHLIESVYDVLECVRLQLRAQIRSAVEQMAEVINGFCPMTLIMNDRRHPQPDQIAFGVIIRAAPPIQPAAREADARHSRSGILQIAPRAPWAAWTKLG